MNGAMTEHRPLLTAAEVVAAIERGERVESVLNDSGWSRTKLSRVTSLDDVASCLDAGIRYRARPAGEGCKCGLRTKLVGDGCAVCNPECAADQSALIRQVQLRDAEIEALRASCEGLLASQQNAMKVAEAAEARAARLAEALEALALTADGIGVPVYFADVQRLRDATHAARAALGPGGGA